MEIVMKVIANFCADKLGYYVVFHRSIIFILGLMIGFKIVESLYFDILITYLIPPSMAFDLRKVAILVNLQAGTSSVLAIFLFFVADAYVGLFNMVISASALCTAGLGLTHFALKRGDGVGNDAMLYFAVAMLTLSEAATLVTLTMFLGDQLIKDDEPAVLMKPELEEKRSEHRIMFWSTIVYICASILTLSGPLKSITLFSKKKKSITWLTDLSRVLSILMGAVFLWFLLGYKFYNRVKPTGSALGHVPAVICNAIAKRGNIVYCQPISPHSSWLRWVDRAAAAQENRLGGRIYSVEEVKEVKSFLKMVPLWLTFITLGFVSACGDTFFLEEAYSITPDQLFPILLLFRLWTFSAHIVARISCYAVEKLSEKKNFNARKMTLVRIGIGMLCCVLCCIAAWSQAVYRLHKQRIHGRKDDGDNKLIRNYRSVYRLVPQFLLLGLMEGFSVHGLGDFFESQVPRPMSRYGPLVGEFVMGVGRFVSIAYILIFSKCFVGFGGDVKTSRIDDFYVVLGGLSCVNLIVYCLVALSYQDSSEYHQDSFY